MELTHSEMIELAGGQSGAWTACGITLGTTIGATTLFGATGFYLTVNKTLVACGIAFVQTTQG